MVVVSVHMVSEYSFYEGVHQRKIKAEYYRVLQEFPSEKNEGIKIIKIFHLKASDNIY